MTQGIDPIAIYVARLAELGEQEDHVGRFFVFQSGDPELDALEERAQNDNPEASGNAILHLYARSRTEMGPEAWEEVAAYNESLRDADRNWLVSEAMT